MIGISKDHERLGARCAFTPSSRALLDHLSFIATVAIVLNFTPAFFSFMAFDAGETSAA
jgi:hypothetical protein